MAEGLMGLFLSACLYLPGCVAVYLADMASASTRGAEGLATVLLGNIIGGVGFVAILNHAQVSPDHTV